MSGTESSTCVLLPCSAGEYWALPQSCLGEIVAVRAEGRQPPAQIDWRGLRLPVLNRWEGDGWSDPRSGTGLVAVLLPLSGEPGSCWGVALGNQGPQLAALQAGEIEELPAPGEDKVLAAFRRGGTVCRVPDLRAWETIMAARGAAA